MLGVGRAVLVEYNCRGSTSLLAIGVVVKFEAYCHVC